MKSAPPELATTGAPDAVDAALGATTGRILYSSPPTARGSRFLVEHFGIFFNVIRTNGRERRLLYAGQTRSSAKRVAQDKYILARTFEK